MCYQNLTISLADTCVMTIIPGHDREMKSEWRHLHALMHASCLSLSSWRLLFWLPAASYSWQRRACLAVAPGSPPAPLPCLHALLVACPALPALKAEGTLIPTSH